MPERSSGPPWSIDDFSDAIIGANRALIQNAVQTIRKLSPEINLTEFRALVLLERRGPLRLVDIAESLEVTATTATRLADQLVGQGLVQRVRQSSDRREVHLTIASSGRSLVRSVAAQRRRFIASATREEPDRNMIAAQRILIAIAGEDAFGNSVEVVS
jgi:DNA-binding MarR family transcriptional regulator